MSSFPVTRLRRLRRTEALRGLVRETSLSLDDLTQPLFVAPSVSRRHAVPSLLGAGAALTGSGAHRRVTGEHPAT